MGTRADSEQNLSHQIESTELLITKYKKEINSLKATTSFDNQDEKSQLIIKVSTLKTKLAELEKENSKLKTNEKNLKRFDGTEAKKVIQDYKNRIIKLSELIKEDDEAIFLFKNNVKNLKKVASQKMNSIDSTSTIQELENRISDLEKQKKTEESIWRQKILMLKLEIDKKNQEIDELAAVFKNKDKICRIKRMKIKAFEREARAAVKESDNQTEYEDSCYKMYKYLEKRNKYLYSSIGLFLGSLITDSLVIKSLGAGAVLYTYFEKTDLISTEMHPDLIRRKLILTELLRDHLLKSEVLNRWMTDRTLQLSKPKTFFRDQGILGLLNLKLGLNFYKPQEFLMTIQWKDEKFHGEGTVFCVGSFTDMNHYFFTDISVSLIRPRKEHLVILDDQTINVP